MEADFWHRLWETNETGWHLDDANPLLVEHFSHLNLQENSRIFIPLCGKTIDIKWLLNKGYKVVGAELNESAIQALFSSFHVVPKVQTIGRFTLYSAEDIEIFVGNIFDLDKETLGSVDAVYDRGALVALPKEMRDDYTSLLLDITQASPQLLINFEYEQSLFDGPPFSIGQQEIEEHYKDSYEIRLLKSFKITEGPFSTMDVSENIWLLKH